MYIVLYIMILWRIIMDIIEKTKQDLINHMLKLMVIPNMKNNGFTEENNKLYDSFISSAVSGKKASVKLPLEYALKHELFELIKNNEVFVESSVKFVASFTTTKPDIESQAQSNKKYINTNTNVSDTRYIGNEFNYAFLDNHPGILNVNKLADIPIDYEGFIAVPPTVLEYKNIVNFNVHRVIQTPIFNGKHIYSRVVITNKTIAQ